MCNMDAICAQFWGFFCQFFSVCLCIYLQLAGIGCKGKVFAPTAAIKGSKMGNEAGVCLVTFKTVAFTTFSILFGKKINKYKYSQCISKKCHKCICKSTMLLVSNKSFLRTCAIFLTFSKLKWLFAQMGDFNQADQERPKAGKLEYKAIRGKNEQGLSAVAVSKKNHSGLF